jgi:hypothetical protein
MMMRADESTLWIDKETGLPRLTDLLLTTNEATTFARMVLLAIRHELGLGMVSMGWCGITNDRRASYSLTSAFGMKHANRGVRVEKVRGIDSNDVLQWEYHGSMDDFLKAYRLDRDGYPND